MERVAVASPVAPTESAGAAARRTWPLVALGAAALPCYAWAAWRGDLAARPVEFAALFVALCLLHAAAAWWATRPGRTADDWRRPLPLAVPIVLFALLYRLLFVPATPSLSDDFFRYVWDEIGRAHV